VIFRFADPLCESSLFSDGCSNFCDGESCKVRVSKLSSFTSYTLMLVQTSVTFILLGNNIWTIYVYVYIYCFRT